MFGNGLYVILHAKKGKEAEVAAFLKSGLDIVNKEQGTATWYAFQINESTFGIFDTFKTEEGRNAHLSGKVAEALMAKASDLLSAAPVIEKFNLLAQK